MKREWWKPLGIVGALLTLLTLLLAQSRSADLGLTTGMQQAIRSYSLHDAELTRDVLAARAGLRSNYDPLAQDRRNLVGALKELHAQAAAGSAERRQFLALHLARMTEAQGSRLASVERFKSENALLQNSLRYVTSAGPVLHLPSAQRSYSADISLLSNLVLHFMQVRDSDDELEIEAVLDRLELTRGAQPELGTLVAHGRLIVRLIPQTNDLLHLISQPAADDAVAALQKAVMQFDSAVEQRAQVYRLLLYLVAVLLLAYVVVQFAHLRREALARARAAAALRTSEERLRAISESAREAIVTVDAAGRIVWWNPGAAVMFGYELGEILGHSFTRMWPPAYRRDHERALGEFFRSDDVRLSTAAREFTGLRRDGGEFPVEVSFSTWATGEGRFVTAIMRDITERTQMQADLRQKELQLIQKNRMADLGLVASRITHDINHSLQPIVSHPPRLGRACQELMQHIDERAPWPDEAPLVGRPYGEMRTELPDVAREVCESAQFIKGIVEDLRFFYVPRASHPDETFQFNDAVARAVRFLGSKKEERTSKFSFRYAPDLPPARGDARHFGQVVLNLLVNALEALPDRSRGVTVATAFEADRQRLVLTVEDEGIGIPKSHLGRIFEPFFTTKHESGGTGLGLATTRILLKELGGDLRFESEPGRGTRAIVELDCVGASAGRV